MKRLLLIGIIVFSGCRAFAQQYIQPIMDTALLFSSAKRNLQQNRDDSVIRKMLEDQALEWNKGSIEGFMKGYWKSDSLIFIGSPEHGYNATLQRYKAKYPDAAHMGKLTLTMLSIKKLSDEYYFVIGKWALKRAVGNVDGNFTLLIKRINGELAIIVDHSS